MQMDSTEAVTEIPVWFTGTQRWVTGLTKRTTCDDVIYALLYNDGKHEDERTDKYTIYERWRDVERPLQGRTKILKIWKAWDEEQRNVQLSMRHVDEFDEYGEFLHARRHRRRSRHKTRDGHSSHPKESTHKHKSSNRLKSIDDLAKTVIKQERKLHDMGYRLEGIDKEIELYETNVHQTRMQTNGTDYVQDAYLKGGLEDSMDEFLRKIGPDSLEMYIEFCERVLQLESKIKKENSIVQELSYQINEEASFNQAFCGADNVFEKEFCNSELETELSSLQAELNRIVSANMMQKYEAAEIAREIDTCDKVLSDKQKTIQTLQKELEILDRFENENKVSSEVQEYRAADLPSNSSADYVNIETITMVPSQDYALTSSASGVSGQTNDPFKKSFIDNDDTFSIDTDNTSNDSQFGYSKESTPKNGHRRNCLFIPHGKMFDDSLISERIKSEIYSYKSRSECHLKNDGFVSATMNNNSRSDCCAKVVDDDSNSDTGLSSMHSDDATTPYNFLETLV
ncbi:ras association domain-containing protein 10-like isoform X1 [Mytilus galloprovincialis]|uniref:ras association domain-containing protein 10-like isoform X1 n=1 Tax=Mytilus galloprovincialis TaxID=29158 RepID=UPI003F7C1424